MVGAGIGGVCAVPNLTSLRQTRKFCRVVLAVMVRLAECSHLPRGKMALRP